MKALTPETRERAGAIRFVLMDSDGVLTDGRLIIGPDGTDLRCFDVKDGHGIRMGQQAGMQFGVISGRRSGALALRAKELDFVEVHQGIHDKLACMNEILQRRSIDPASVCYIGDDLIDLTVMRRVGFSVAPADALPEALETADWVTSRDGGRGAVRETIDLLLKSGGHWDEITARYRE